MLDFHFAKAKRKGFTILEALVSLGIFLLILWGVAAFVSVIFSSQNIIYSQLSSQKEARRAVEDFVKEARNASASSIGSYLVAEAAPASFVFYSDIDSDTFRERVRYFIDGTNLKKGVIKPAGTPLSYNPASETITVAVHDLISGQQPFSYFGKDYNGNSAPLNFPVNVIEVRLVRFSLTIDQKPGFSPLPISVASEVELRNLKYAE
ncbi:MAG: prepilin-type N-terminal cleavage/methylation domain-containing protein [Candidatus Magasanikbacteria bacterium]|nr:prepilin-type N-terminal cleavage/methylation domain-containing protein [Candidatus Magasanikbacteria bacterium]